jgi:Uma2 family endonuclease
MSHTVPDILLDMFARLPSDMKAEIVDGEIHVMPPAGHRPGRATGSILFSLMQYEGTVPGVALGSTVAFIVDLPNRQSFSPDASWFTGMLPEDLGWVVGAPAFAVEVRSEGDYGPAAERRMAEKRADYFAAGTLVVWDVDLLGEDTVRSYRASAPDVARVYRRGETADAEPAVPGWRFAVDELFA